MILRCYYLLLLLLLSLLLQVQLIVSQSSSEDDHVPDKPAPYIPRPVDYEGDFKILHDELNESLNGVDREYYIAIDEIIWDYTQYSGDIPNNTATHFWTTTSKNRTLFVFFVLFWFYQTTNYFCFIKAPSPLLPFCPPPPLLSFFFYFQTRLFIITVIININNKYHILGPTQVGNKYYKAVYREYTDNTYATLKPRPQWQGLLGPILRAEVGDTLRVHLWNRASHDFSMHPHVNITLFFFSTCLFIYIIFLHYL